MINTLSCFIVNRIIVRDETANKAPTHAMNRNPLYIKVNRLLDALLPTWSSVSAREQAPLPSHDNFDGWQHSLWPSNNHDTDVCEL